MRVLQELVLKEGKFEAFKSHRKPIRWSKEDSYKGGGIVQVVRKSSGIIVLRFRDFFVNNENDVTLKIVLLRSKLLQVAGLIREVQHNGETLLLDYGLQGTVKGAFSVGCFEQEMHLYNPLDFGMVIVCKPAAAKPVTVQPAVYLYARLDPYVASDEIEASILDKKRKLVEIEIVERIESLKSEREQYTVEDIKKNAHNIFKKFDFDQSGSIDFSEFKSMMAHQGIKLLESQARRFFDYCDDNCSGEIDEDAFEVALHMANYFNENPNNLHILPTDAFMLFDGNGDGLLNQIEFEQAMLLMKVSTSKKFLERAFNSSKVEMTMHINLRKFKECWLTLADEEKELRQRKIKFSSRGKLRMLKRHDLATQNKLLLKNVIVDQEKQQLDALEHAKQLVSKMQQTRREETQAMFRETQKHRHKAEIDAKTQQALLAKNEKMVYRQRLQVEQKAKRDEDKIRMRLSREATLRNEYFQLAKKRVMQTEETLECNRIARMYEDYVNFSNLGKTSFPSSLYVGKEASIGLSSLLELSLSRNNISSIPEGICYNLNLLQKLDMAQNKLTMLPADFHQLTRLRICYLQNNLLSSISNVVRVFHELEILDVSFNQIQQLPTKLEWPKVRQFFASGNKLGILPIDFGCSMAELKILHLGNNSLATLPESIGQLANLKELDISSNFLRQVCTTLGNLHNLVECKVQFNELRQLPQNLGSLKNLQLLNVSYNKLIALPSTIGDLENLIIAQLQHNQLRLLPSQLYRLFALERLYLEGNNLKYISFQLGLLQNLKCLRIRKNVDIIHIPAEIGALGQLLEADFSYCKIKGNLPEETGFLVNLQRMDLQHNRISHLCLSLAQLINLVTLNLQCNLLEDHKHLSKCMEGACALEYINLSQNNLKRIPKGICKLPRLKELYVSMNRIEQVPSELGDVSSLHLLDLYNNRLQSLPATLHRLVPNLHQFFIGKNPLTHVRQAWWNVSQQQLIQIQNPVDRSENEIETAVRDWLEEQYLLQEAIAKVWNKFSLTIYINSNDSSATEHFIHSVKEELGISWQIRFVGTLRRSYWRLRKVGNIDKFHINADDDDVEHEWTLMRKQRSEMAIHEARTFASSQNLNYHQNIHRRKHRGRTKVKSANIEAQARLDRQNDRAKAIKQEKLTSFIGNVRFKTRKLESNRSNQIDPEEEAYRWRFYRRTGVRYENLQTDK